MNNPKQLAEVIADSSFNQIIQGVRMVLQWERVVDKTIARETQALKFEKGVLFVEVSNSVWASELKFLKQQVLEKLNHNRLNTAVKDIKFLVKGVAYGKG